MVTSKLSTSYALKATGSIPEGIGYAIKGYYVARLIGLKSEDSSERVRPTRLSLEDLAARVSESVVLIISQ